MARFLAVAEVRGCAAYPRIAAAVRAVARRVFVVPARVRGLPGDGRNPRPLPSPGTPARRTRRGPGHRLTN